MNWVKKGNDTIRLTQALVKEALFNILAEQIVGASFLDLYAGEGGVGLDALKRGAERVAFVEIDRRRVEIIRGQLKKMGIKTKVSQGDVLKILKRIDLDFDIIFLDPPYNKGLVVPTLDLIGQQANLPPTLLVVAEHYYKEEMFPKIGSLNLTKQRRYGETTLSLYRIGD